VVDNEVIEIPAGRQQLFDFGDKIGKESLFNRVNEGNFVVHYEVTVVADAFGQWPQVLK
jgi:hypothetical protein